MDFIVKYHRVVFVVVLLVFFFFGLNAQAQEVLQGKEVLIVKGQKGIGTCLLNSRGSLAEKISDGATQADCIIFGEKAQPSLRWVAILDGNKSVVKVIEFDLNTGEEAVVWLKDAI